MKIKLKTDNDTILAVDQMLEKAHIAQSNTSTRSINERVIISLSLELSDMFHTRARQIIREKNLFNNQKKKDLTLKYHQAWALEQIILSNTSHFPSIYQQSLVSTLAHKLNKKLT